MSLVDILEILAEVSQNNSNNNQLNDYKRYDNATTPIINLQLKSGKVTIFGTGGAMWYWE